MTIAPKIQSHAIDMTAWESDAEFAVFPQGARAKDAVFAPGETDEQDLRSNWRYLFKRSKRSYPDQFWGEVIAYRIGCLLGLEVPAAFAAVNTATEHCGALIEWFYDDSHERFVLAGDFLQKLRANFDRDKGTRHNLVDNSILLKAFSRNQSLSFETDWRQWWANALLFDALIGNTDRHQDNWGLVIWNDDTTVRSRLSPLFDNGTSLGHERFPDRTACWSDSDVHRYCARGTHHARWSLADNPPIRGHIELLHRAMSEWPETRLEVRTRLAITYEQLHSSFADLTSIAMPVPLTEERHGFILRLLNHRLNSLQYALL